MFSWDGPLPEPQIRMVEDLKQVLAETNCPARGPAYYMYRDLAISDKDRKWLHAHKLRYDVTVIPPAVFSGEYVKTKGHYHPDNPRGIGYPEIYEIIAGSAEYLLQRRDMSDAVSISAKKGDLILIPPGYGHVTINPGDSTLTMSNIVSTAFSSIYGDYEELQGAMYFRTAEKGFIANPRYGKVSPLRHVKGCNLSGFPGLAGRTLYSMIGDDKALDFLNYPEHFRFDTVLQG